MTNVKSTFINLVEIHLSSGRCLLKSFTHIFTSSCLILSRNSTNNFPNKLHSLPWEIPRWNLGAGDESRVDPKVNPHHHKENKMEFILTFSSRVLKMTLWNEKSEGTEATSPRRKDPNIPVQPLVPPPPSQSPETGFQDLNLTERQNVILNSKDEQTWTLMWRKPAPWRKKTQINN